MIDTLLGIKKENNRKSCLIMAIRSARYLTGRDLKTGHAKDIREMRINVLMKDDVTNYWIEEELFFSGIVMYLIVLDSIGCIFEQVGEKPFQGNGIKKALKMFSSLTVEEIDACIDLRNTLAHNFGLATEKKNVNGKQKIKRHKFSLDFSETGTAIKLPKKDWDGEYGKSSKDESSSTIIGVSAFCDLVESIIGKLYDNYDSGKLKLRINDNEAKSRFTVLV